ncbi:MAG: DUF192 domain-containing protein [Pseudomonadota bacterium]
MQNELRRLVLLLSVTFCVFCSQKTSASSPAYIDSLSKVIFKIDSQNYEYILETATTQEQKQKGLMFRTELDENKGMLFVYDPPQIVGIWMKNTMIPLFSSSSVLNIRPFCFCA